MFEDVTFCGVFDGHGPFGHLVARKVRDTLPVKLQSFFHALQSKQNGRFRRSSSKSAVQEAAKEGSDEDKLKGLWGEAFFKSFKAMDKELRSHPNVDCFCSGSTAVTILKQVKSRKLVLSIPFSGLGRVFRVSVYRTRLATIHFLDWFR